MPRDGSNIYHRPVGTDAVPNAPIESAKYNANVADVEQDLNLPRPIVAGGTGANNAHDAMLALGGEIANQFVDNYDTFPFVAGSFYSNPGATSAPNNTNYFSGICYTAGTTLITLEARVITGNPAVIGQKYVRTKDSSGWSAWTIQVGNAADLNDYYDARFVNVGGDSMTGALTATQFHTPGDASGGYYFGPGGSQYLRWQTDNAAFNLGGGHLLTSADIRANGNLYANGGGVYLNSAANVGMLTDGTNAIYRAAGAHYFQSSPDGATWAVVAPSGAQVYGSVHSMVGVVASRAPASSSSTFRFEDVNGAYKGYVQWDGAGSIIIYNSAAPSPINFLSNGRVRLSEGLACKSAIGAYSGNMINFNYPGIECWIDTTYFGNLAFTSDYRVKKDVLPLPGMWETVKKLKPISYTHTDFSSPSHVTLMAEQAAKHRSGEVTEPPPGPHFVSDGIERWGFLAHELQETLIENAATGVKDDPAAYQSPNPWTVIATLTKALQEAMGRIEALEARA